MCGRFYVAITEKELLDIIDTVEEEMRKDYRGLTLKKEGEIFPGDIVPVLIGPHEAKPMKWGFMVSDGKTIINARSETAKEKPMFKSAMTNRRCLILASGYFEWKKEGKAKVKYAFHHSDELLYLAGCYRMEKNSSLPTFVILTRNAEGDLQKIHDRMPVILPKDKITQWLEGKDVQKDAVTDLEYWQVVGDGLQMKLDFLAPPDEDVLR
jgi:putative SOS response-associated peptidase YedK